MDLDILEAVTERLKEDIQKNCEHLGTSLIPDREYVFNAGRNRGLLDALELIKNVTSGKLKEELD